MLRAVLLSATVGLVAALPQNIDFAAVNAAPTPAVQGAPLAASVASQVPTFNPSSAAASAAEAVSTNPVATANAKRALEARTACAPQPTGAAPVTSPDTAADFLENPIYNNTADSAPVPQGYQLVFSDLEGSTSQNGYLGYYTLQSYDTIKCQEECDAATGCTAFNVYFERDPTVDPGTNCPNPASTVNIKCVLWGLPITAATATNDGQWRDQFQVVIAGSNGYVKNAAPPALTNFTGPTELGGAINAPLNSQGQNTYIGMRMFPGPYDPSQCAAVCQATTQYDSQHPASDGTYMPCNFFNSYVLSENNAPEGTYCSFYTQAWGKSYATNYGQYDGQGNYYSVSSSYSYTLTTQDPGVVASS